MAGMDPTGLLAWAVNKILDRVVEYVKEAKKYVEHCDELQGLLERIKPLVSQAIPAEPNAALNAAAGAPSSTAVDAWLQSLEPLLKEAEETLREVVEKINKARQGRFTPIIHKKEKYSKQVSMITERIRNTIGVEVGLAILAEMRGGTYKPEAARGGGEDQRVGAIVQEHPLTSRLWQLRRKSMRDERCRAKLEIADMLTPRFHIPAHDHDQSRSGGASPAAPAANTALWEKEMSNELDGHHRGRVFRGGIEVNNITKLKITIQVEFEEDWFFYVLFVDHNSSAQLAGYSNAPELNFPAEDLDDDCNSVNRKQKRVFPDQHVYEEDPHSLKLSRSNDAPADACQQISLFLLIVSSRFKLPEDKPDLQRFITIQDIQNHLETPHLDIIVKHWLFDINPPMPN